MCSSAPTVAISVVRARAIGPRPERRISEAPDWARGGSKAAIHPDDPPPATVLMAGQSPGRGCPTPRYAGLCRRSRMRSAACQRVLARTRCGPAKGAAGFAVSACGAGNVSRRGFALAPLPAKPELSDASPGRNQCQTYTTCGTGLLASSMLPSARGHRWVRRACRRGGWAQLVRLWG
jgi:hypothetical protein